ncbi:hypothetical protein V3C33_01740 [Micrococcaceae bacterium Sec5.7]
MRASATVDDPFIRAGLVRLQQEVFAEGGLGYGADEVVSTSVARQGMAQRRVRILRDGAWGGRDFHLDFSHEAMDAWVLELRRHLYVVGAGTWVTYRFHVFPAADGRLEVFDEEIFPLDQNGKRVWNSSPAGAGDLHAELVAFPRTVDNIPAWMWEVFRAEGVMPPVYNPVLRTVDWKNRRLPVTEDGTDFSVDDMVIDPSKEPGFFSKIGRKLFGS